MRKQVLVWLGILSLIALVSCRPKNEPVLESEKTSPDAAAPVMVVATVTGDSLRVRAMPYLDAEIIGHLMTGDRIVVESRTEWTESIGELNASWFFVRTGGYSGWTYGGYLDFGSIEPAAISPDPGVSPPVVDSTPVQESVTAFGAINTATLPEILLPVFGLEEKPLVSDPTEGVITYDSYHENLLLPFSDSPDSRLRSFSAGELPDRLRIVAEFPGPSGYEQSYGPGDFRVLSRENPGFSDAILVPFYRLATLEAGFWEIYAFLGNDNWPVAVGKVEISPSEISIVPASEPDPMRHSPRSRYSRGDTAYAFGNRKAGSGHLQVALYNDSGEYRDGKILLRPVAAYQVETDSSGFWSVDFYLGEEFPDGRCWAAVGDPIKGLENLCLFMTSVEL
ncbi:MAG: hypothetical protein KAJ98_13920 [Spirochaetaceae bacterium]|nr:hypothetical protein [Spirochaetaceae bacterium]